jgi:hypothetical protein
MAAATENTIMSGEEARRPVFQFSIRPNCHPKHFLISALSCDLLGALRTLALYSGTSSRVGGAICSTTTVLAQVA